MSEKLALCETCASEHQKKKGHNVVSMQMFVNEARTVLLNLERSGDELIRD